MKTVQIPMDDDDHTDLTRVKNAKNWTWKEMLEHAADIAEEQ